MFQLDIFHLKLCKVDPILLYTSSGKFSAEFWLHDFCYKEE